MKLAIIATIIWSIGGPQEPETIEIPFWVLKKALKADLSKNTRLYILYINKNIEWVTFVRMLRARVFFQIRLDFVLEGEGGRKENLDFISFTHMPNGKIC